ncbi:MAG: hypothetical protein B7Z81_13755 [Acidocella sp. 20-61-6]|nr:MAG: hypothetical protein B7Z81_13755 [Acidocella sp. 20-61-6]
MQNFASTIKVGWYMKRVLTNFLSHSLRMHWPGHLRHLFELRCLQPIEAGQGCQNLQSLRASSQLEQSQVLEDLLVRQAA